MRATVSALAGAALLLAAAPLTSQTIPCAPREQLLRFIIDQRGEVRQAIGHTSRGAQMALFAGDEGSWSMVLFLPDGRACLLANGIGFEAANGLQPARGNPA